MFVFMKMINEESVYNKAIKQFKAQFPDYDYSGAHDEDVYLIKYNREADKPYVLVINQFKNGKMTRKEWYEFEKDKWELIGYLTAAESTRLHRDMAWNKNKTAFASREEYIKFAKDRGWYTSDEEAARTNHDEYAAFYRQLNLHKN